MPASRDGRHAYDDFSGSEDPIDPRRVLAMLRRRRIWIVLSTLVAMSGVLVLTFGPPNLYEAHCRVANEGTPEVMEIGAGFMPAERSVADMPAAAISNEVLGRVVDEMGAIAPPPATREWRSLLRAWQSWMTPAQELSTEQIRQSRIRSLRGALSLSYEAGGAVMVVTAHTGDPDAAAALANTVAREFVSYQNEQRQAAFQRASVWLTERALELRAAIERREEALAELVVRESPSKRRQDPAQKEFRMRLEADFQAAQLELLAAEQRLNDMTPRITAMTATESKREVALQRQVYLDAKQKLELARLLFTATHPEVIRLEARVAELEAKLSDETLLDAQLEQGRREQEFAEFNDLKRRRDNLETRVAVLRKALRRTPRPIEQNDEPSETFLRIERELAIDRDTMDLILRRRNELNLSAETDPQATRILDPAIAPVEPVGPNRRARLGVGATLAIGLGLGMGLLLELFDNRVTEGAEAQAILEYPLLGSVPRVAVDRRGSVREERPHSSIFLEAIETIRAELMLAIGRHSSGDGSTKIGTILVTSGVAGEGKTTISRYLAGSFAAAGQRTLLVDGDMRRPRVHQLLELPAEPGLAEVLRGELPVEEITHRPPGCDFDVLVSGRADALPPSRLSSPVLESLFSKLTATRDVVVVDAPVLLSVADALMLASEADGVLLVYRPDSLDRAGLESVRRGLEHAGARVLGLVMSQVDPKDPYQYPPYLSSPYARHS